MRKTKSPILDAVHQTAKGLHRGGVMDQAAWRELDCKCLPRGAEAIAPRAKARA